MSFYKFGNRSIGFKFVSKMPLVASTFSNLLKMAFSSLSLSDCEVRNYLFVETLGLEVLEAEGRQVGVEHLCVHFLLIHIFGLSESVGLNSAGLVQVLN